MRKRYVSFAEFFFFNDYIFTVWGSETEQKLKQGQSLGMV